MHALASYDYAIVRVVPRVERGECINVGVLLFCRTRRFLGALLSVDLQSLIDFASDIDIDEVKMHLDHIPLICAGGKDAGPIGQLSQSERFHWLVSPRSTVIQTSPVHAGLCSDPEAELRRLLEKMVLPPSLGTNNA